MIRSAIENDEDQSDEFEGRGICVNCYLRQNGFLTDVICIHVTWIETWSSGLKVFRVLYTGLNRTGRRLVAGPVGAWGPLG